MATTGSATAFPGPVANNLAYIPWRWHYKKGDEILIGLSLFIRIRGLILANNIYPKPGNPDWLSNNWSIRCMIIRRTMTALQAAEFTDMVQIGNEGYQWNDVAHSKLPDNWNQFTA